MLAIAAATPTMTRNSVLSAAPRSSRISAVKSFKKTTPKKSGLDRARLFFSCPLQLR